MSVAVWLLFSDMFLAFLALLHEPVQVAEICHGIVGLTFTAPVPSACNLTDQRTESHQSALNGKYSR